MNEFFEMMRFSGYSETNQIQIVKSGGEDFEKIEGTGERPVNKFSLFEEDVRRKRRKSSKKETGSVKGVLCSLICSPYPLKGISEKDESKIS